MVAAVTSNVAWTAVAGTNPLYTVQWRLNGDTLWTDNPLGSTPQLAQPITMIPDLYDIRLKINTGSSPGSFSDDFSDDFGDGGVTGGVDSFSDVVTTVIGESDNATTLPPVNLFTIINSFGEEFEINPGGQVVVDNTPDATTSSVTLIYYDRSVTPGRVWYRNSANVWRWKTRASDPWAVGVDPRVNPWTIDFSIDFGPG